MPELLHGVTVIEVAQNVAAPFCGRVLSDLGARVIKVERPGRGDDMRSWTRPGTPRSSGFVTLNRNKESIALNFRDPEGNEAVACLAQHADVFIHNLRPGVAEKHGLGYEELAARNPRLVYCAISAFGEAGALRGEPGYDPLIQAFTGLMHMSSDGREPPARVRTSIIDLGTGLWAALGVLAALIERNRTGCGMSVGASLLETGIAWQEGAIVAHLLGSGADLFRGALGGFIAPYEPFRVNDGWILIAAGNDRLFERLCQAVDLPNLLEIERFETNPRRVANRDELHRLIEERTLCYSAAECERLLRHAGVPVSRFQRVEEMVSDQQVQALGMIRPLPDDGTQVVDLPLRFGTERGSVRSAPPTLGANTESILLEMGYAPGTIADLRARGVIA